MPAAPTSRLERRQSAPSLPVCPTLAAGPKGRGAPFGSAATSAMAHAQSFQSLDQMPPVSSTPLNRSPSLRPHAQPQSFRARPEPFMAREVDDLEITRSEAAQHLCQALGLGLPEELAMIREYVHVVPLALGEGLTMSSRAPGVAPDVMTQRLGASKSSMAMSESTAALGVRAGGMRRGSAAERKGVADGSQYLFSLQRGTVTGKATEVTASVSVPPLSPAYPSALPYP